MTSTPAISHTANPSGPRIPATLTARLAKRVTADASVQTLERTTPLTGETLGAFPVSTPADVETAYERARTAQISWAARPVKERVEFLAKLHDLVLDHRDELLDLIQLESGKARIHAFDEVLDMAGVCRHYAKKAPSYLAPQKSLGALPLVTQATTHYRPKGVIGIVAPWNYPLSMTITDALPALVAGNAVVLRPDDKATYTCLRAVELIDEAGLPEGLLQVVLGDGPNVGAAVLELADYVMFTGSTKTGRMVARNAGERLIGASLELGGKNAMYVAADANLAAAAECAQRAVFSSAGQLCISIERLVLHESIADDFLALFLARVKKMKLGVDLTWGADMGSLISADQLKVVTEHVDDAVAKGATVLAGGKARPDLGPYVFEPTVLDRVPEDAICRRNETFGPLVSVYRVSSDDEAIDFINDSEFGLNASVWTRDLDHGRALAARIKTGTVNVNEGFAAAYASNGSVMGGMKASGLGRRHGAPGIQKYTEMQNVSVQRGPGFGVPRGMSQQTFAKAFTLGMRALKTFRVN